MRALAALRCRLAPGQPVVEAGGGTFSAALCIAARRSGHPVLLAVPPTLEGERQKFHQRLGATLVISMAALQGRKKLWALARQTAEEQGG